MSNFEGWDDMGNYTNFVPGLERTELAQREFEWHTFMDYARGDHDPNPVSMDTPHTPNLAYRLAYQIQEHLVQLISTEEYTVGRAERYDRARDYVDEHLSQEVEPASLAYEGLTYWFKIFGRGVQGE